MVRVIFMCGPAGFDARWWTSTSTEATSLLDFSFWSRAMREEWRGVVGPFGVTPETIYVQTDRATCLARVAAREHAHCDDFALDAATAAA